MKNIFVLFCCIGISLTAQRPAADQIRTNRGELVIQPVFHGALVFTWKGKSIYVDPYGGAKAFEGLGTPDIILITDIHPDHLDMETLRSLNTTNTKFIVPQVVADKVSGDLKGEFIVLRNNESTSQQGISFKAIPMYNLPEAADAKHTKGRGNGYVFDLGGKTIYISGDTEDIPEMRSLKNIDVAFVCMNLPYTMDINQAASAVLEFKPRIVYPYHYRGKDGLSDTEEFKKLVNKDNSKIEVRLRNWYHVY